ncbi:Sulfotransferase domain superfamily protein [Candidatus Methylomirabilis lanthanidiphila]|uniref:Sulfotransferase domain superfamily protein n=1 Tax=Candidatus Methylomirabilis lanthanidiphila TaxID=2211376 RepID=A0A564ZK32_9BACT|nr:sulfotransferase [Candidatus Methylomirabilis lanthanidiphila]VUZ85699.1 Sulfotransferase domain superfamily protein [Candidatus Methylomirabilis lanthanidiphila]
MRPPAFIGGFRSGSTLLINYLGLHPRLSAVYETKFLVDLLRIVRLIRDNGEGAGRELDFLRGWVGRQGLTRAEAVEIMIKQAVRDISLTQQVLDGTAPDGKAGHERYALGTNHILWQASEALETIGPFVEAVRAGHGASTLLPALASSLQALFAMHAAREGKREWVNKTPEILRFQPELRQMLGRVRFIHLIRDGRDVVHSSVRLHWWSVETGSRAWKLFIDEVRAHVSVGSQDYLELRYEDLVTDHVGTLRRVLDFLDIDGDPEAMVAAQERLAPGSTSRSEAEARMGQWRSAMTAGDRATFKAIANDLLISLGYASDADW